MEMVSWLELVASYCHCDHSLQVTVGELLRAAGVSSLEEESDTVNAKGRSFRERGLILRVTIFYQNWFSCWFGTR